jgi:hypothetical protein
MSALKTGRKYAPIIFLELVMFVLVLATLWLDEFLDLPHRIFNAAPTPYRIEEYLIETLSVVLVGSATILLTLLLMRRLRRSEEFLHVCAWCKRVFLDDRWVEFEDYMLQRQDLSSSHGICESCAQKVQSEIAPSRQKL